MDMELIEHKIKQEAKDVYIRDLLNDLKAHSTEDGHKIIARINNISGFNLRYTTALQECINSLVDAEIDKLKDKTC